MCFRKGIISPASPSAPFFLGHGLCFPVPVRIGTLFTEPHCHIELRPTDLYRQAYMASAGWVLQRGKFVTTLGVILGQANNLQPPLVLRSLARFMTRALIFHESTVTIGHEPLAPCGFKVFVGFLGGGVSVLVFNSLPYRALGESIDPSPGNT